MSATALIANIQGYSIHDGPGIRTVVFLKGCPLRCRWCANPENLQDKVRTGFLANLCQHCGRCAKACPRGAILPDPDKRIDRSRCDECCQCVEACFYGALVRYGEPKTAEMKKRELYFRQKELLDTFLENGAISRAQYDKSLGDLTVKMGIDPEER